jgi:hypothetical protein
VNDPGLWGNARDWGVNLAAVKDRSPAVGAVAWWSAGNHVAYVEEVRGDRIRVTADNYIDGGLGYTDSGWISASSVEAFLHPYRKPAKPTKVPAQPNKPNAVQVGGSKAVSVSWGAVTGATKYRVQVSANGGKSWKRATLNDSRTSLTVNGTAYSRTYVFQVQAGNAKGWGKFSAYSDRVTVRRIPPAEPGKPAASQAGSGKAVNLSWPPVAGATKYRYQWSNNRGATWKIGGIVRGSSATWGGPAFLRTYIFQVQAFSPTGGWGRFSAYSNPVTVTKAAPGEPAKPAAAQVAGASKISLSWPAVPDADRYRYQWSNDGGATWHLTGVSPRTSATFGGAYGRTYIFQVQAGNLAGWGPFSAYSDPVTPTGAAPGEPGKPAALPVPGTSSITVSWPAVPGATGYRYQWSNDGGATWHLTGTSSRTSATFGGARGRTYIFQVLAWNAAGGWGPFSAYSDPVAP